MAAVDFGGLDNILSGGSIAPKLGNETLKYVEHKNLRSRSPKFCQPILNLQVITS